jgi:phosphatidylserine/phosphatidylglycerophosphate/cardiolipin synthase-like enzyme
MTGGAIDYHEVALLEILDPRKIERLHSATCALSPIVGRHQRVAAAGMPVWVDDRARVAHEKALIIDRRVTIMGSYNFSAGAALDSEDRHFRGSR